MQTLRSLPLAFELEPVIMDVEYNRASRRGRDPHESIV
jgi:hypothetical protein